MRFILRDSRRDAFAVFRQAFRPFFLIGASFSSLAMLFWVGTLNGWVNYTPYGGLVFWHGHEMLFGFVAAIVVGFLLTAIQNWTGLRATNGFPLALLVSVWIAGRVAMAGVLPLQSWVVAVIDLSFLPFSAMLLTRLVVRARNYRNLFFVPLLLILSFCNFLTHASVIKTTPAYFHQGAYAAIMIICLMMVVVSGRVIPMFTANGTGTGKVMPNPLLEKLCICSVALLLILFLQNWQQALNSIITATLCYLAATANLIRWFRWRPWITVKVPLLWSLHLAYLFIPLSLLGLGLHYSGATYSLSTAMHGLTAGAMGTLILAMISRVSLGHSGRPLRPHVVMSFAFGAVIAAGIFRILAGLELFSALLLLTVSACLWIVGYVIFVFVYCNVLTSPRPDGQPG